MNLIDFSLIRLNCVRLLRTGNVAARGDRTSENFVPRNSPFGAQLVHSGLLPCRLSRYSVNKDFQFCPEQCIPPESE